MPTRHLLGTALGTVCLVVIALSAAGQTPATSSSTARSPALVGITAENLRAHVEALGEAVMLGRDTPGPGGDLAALYVARAFAAAGI